MVFLKHRDVNVTRHLENLNSISRTIIIIIIVYCMLRASRLNIDNTAHLIKYLTKYQNIKNLKIDAQVFVTY